MAQDLKDWNPEDTSQWDSALARAIATSQTCGFQSPACFAALRFGFTGALLPFK